MSHVYVAIGSNVRPEENVLKAARDIQRRFPDARFSSWYRNPAVGFTGEDFINGVVGFTTELQLTTVIEQLQAVEALCGRPRDAPRWAPRAMDLDVLLFDDLVRSEPTRLPRPDLLKRPYMLGPLAEIAPLVLHPTAGMTIGELWQRFDQAAHTMTRVDLSDQEPVEAAKDLPHSGHHQPPEPAR
jgi:2-amino-4-hydroxy-6-hydroxymethyldihydropteridine diphosphokinase